MFGTYDSTPIHEIFQDLATIPRIKQLEIHCSSFLKDEFIWNSATSEESRLFTQQGSYELAQYWLAKMNMLESIILLAGHIDKIVVGKFICAIEDEEYPPSGLPPILASLYGWTPDDYDTAPLTRAMVQMVDDQLSFAPAIDHVTYRTMRAAIGDSSSWSFPFEGYQYHDLEQNQAAAKMPPREFSSYGDFELECSGFFRTRQDAEAYYKESPLFEGS